MGARAGEEDRPNTQFFRVSQKVFMKGFRWVFSLVFFAVSPLVLPVILRFTGVFSFLLVLAFFLRLLWWSVMSEKVGPFGGE